MEGVKSPRKRGEGRQTGGVNPTPYSGAMNLLLGNWLVKLVELERHDHEEEYIQDRCV